MAKLRKRCVKMMKKKHNKIIDHKRLDEVWAQYVEHCVIKPLLKTGYAQIDKYTTLEIIGQKPEKNALYYANMVEGRAFTKSGRFTTPIVHRNRKDYIYKLVITDKNYKGQVIFNADKNLSKLVRESLENTQTYYRLLN